MVPFPPVGDRDTPQRRLAGTDGTLEDKGGRSGGNAVEERSDGRDFAVAVDARRAAWL